MDEFAARLNGEIVEAENKLACYMARWDTDYDARKRSEYWRGVRDGLRAAAALCAMTKLAEGEG